jgi:Tfp pilus assembly protein PilN
MSTQEDRIAALERKVAAIELRRLYDERKAEENTPSVQAFNLREINENMTILLGVSSSQGGDIKAIKENVSSINDRLEGVEQRLDRLETKSDEQTTLLTQILARLPEKPWQ